MKYVIVVKTGNVSGIGTDANVSVQLRGSKGAASPLLLDTPDHNDFERYQQDAFHFVANDVGDIHTITIGHDNSAPASGWFRAGRLSWKSWKEQDLRRRKYRSWLCSVMVWRVRVRNLDGPETAGILAGTYRRSHRVH